MKIKFVSVVVCLAFVAMVAVPAASILIPSASAAGPPVWNVGDQWVYNTHYDSIIPPYGGTLPVVNDGQLITTVTDTSDPSLYTMAADYVPDAARVATSDALNMPLTVPQAVVKNNKSNMQYAQMDSNVVIGGYHILIIWPYDILAQLTWTYDAPGPTWPLAVNDTWTFDKRTVVKSVPDNVVFFDRTVDREAKVLEEVDLTLPAGTYHCFHIVEYDPLVPGTYTHEHWISEAAGADVKIIDRDTYQGSEVRELASINQVPPYTLTVNAVNGSVTRDPDLPSYPEGTEVTLTAKADPGYHFDHWSGDAEGTDNPKTITMDRDKTVTANFVSILTTTSITPNTLGNGSGNKRAHVTIKGTKFAPSMRVMIVQSGLTYPKRIYARDVVVSSDSNEIDCTLNLKNAKPGAWDVVVRNRDGETAKLTGGLTVNPYPVISRPAAPYSGNRDTVKDFTIKGVNFDVDNKPTVKLTKGLSMPIEIGVTVGDDWTDKVLHCSVNLAGAQAGIYRVVVTNPDGGVGLPKLPFTVL